MGRRLGYTYGRGTLARPAVGDTRERYIPIESYLYGKQKDDGRTDPPMYHFTVGSLLTLVLRLVRPRFLLSQP